MRIALVGGGHAAVTILDHFQLFAEHKVVGVADLKTDAPGILRARELGVDTTTDMGALVRRPGVELVIELTGNARVQESLRSMLRPTQQLVTALGARLMTDLMAAQATRNAAVAGRISQSFKTLTGGLEKTVTNIDESFKRIDSLVRDASIISINARIEAARAGQAGRTFEVVVERIGEMVGQIKDAAGAIGKAADDTRVTLRALAEEEQQLRQSFQ